MAGSPGNPVTRVVVVIPAHDEREGIRACVDSVLAAAAEVDVPVTVRVVLDTCTDGTGEHVPDGVETRTVAVRNVGAAR
ncbi:MAG TPA: glycosyl transferase, partial [Actinomycetales bacterium]|nr:glycosyl transferase [Actinomycetales bacterium]